MAHLQRSLQQCSVQPCCNLKLLPLLIHVSILISKAYAAAAPHLAVHAVADDAVLGDDVVVVAAAVSFCAEGGCVVEEDESATCLQAVCY